MAKLSKRAEAPIDISELSALLERATKGSWRVDRGGTNLNDTIWITAYEREGFRREHNPICSISKKRTHFEKNEGRGGGRESRSWETPIAKAEDDAKLIVAAVNALPELLRRLGYDGTESAWLIEWPADDYGPVRYYAAGRPKPVIDVNKATRFARREDAIAVMGIQTTESGRCEAVEHLWTSAPAVAAEKVDA